ncbi:hypothetical protein HanIR_Chr07g0326461 [Helianthus annuus]|nr:hypothetical protein HanIR_Chr07g0326461 [Helianthus annuus]
MVSPKGSPKSAPITLIIEYEADHDELCSVVGVSQLTINHHRPFQHLVHYFMFQPLFFCHLYFTKQSYILQLLVWIILRFFLLN